MLQKGQSCDSSPLSVQPYLGVNSRDSISSVSHTLSSAAGQQYHRLPCPGCRMYLPGQCLLGSREGTMKPARTMSSFPNLRLPSQPQELWQTCSKALVAKSSGCVILTTPTHQKHLPYSVTCLPSLSLICNHSYSKRSKG